MTNTKDFTPTTYTLDVAEFGYIKVSTSPDSTRWLTMLHAFDSRQRVAGLSRFFDTAAEAMVYGHQIANRIKDGDL